MKILTPRKSKVLKLKAPSSFFGFSFPLEISAEMSFYSNELILPSSFVFQVVLLYRPASLTNPEDSYYNLSAYTFSHSALGSKFTTYVPALRFLDANGVLFTCTPRKAAPISVRVTAENIMRNRTFHSGQIEISALAVPYHVLKHNTVPF